MIALLHHKVEDSNILMETQVAKNTRRTPRDLPETVVNYTPNFSSVRLPLAPCFCLSPCITQILRARSPGMPTVHCCQTWVLLQTPQAKWSTWHWVGWWRHLWLPPTRDELHQTKLYCDGQPPSTAPCKIHNHWASFREKAIVRAKSKRRGEGDIQRSLGKPLEQQGTKTEIAKHVHGAREVKKDTCFRTTGKTRQKKKVEKRTFILINSI